MVVQTYYHYRRETKEHNQRSNNVAMIVTSLFYHICDEGDNLPLYKHNNDVLETSASLKKGRMQDNLLGNPNNL